MSSLAFGRLFWSRAVAALSSSGMALRTFSAPGAGGRLGCGGLSDGLPPDGFGWPDALPPPWGLAFAWASLFGPAWAAAPFWSPLLSSLLRCSAVGSFLSPIGLLSPSFGGPPLAPFWPSLGGPPLDGLPSAPSPFIGSPFSALARSSAFGSLVSSL